MPPRGRAWAAGLLLALAPRPAGTVEGGPLSVLEVEIGGSLCSATLVGPRALLTAAHCGYLLSAELGRLRYGDATFLARVLRSPGYRGPGTHDVALLALDQELPGSAPVPLGGTPAVGAMVTLSGYGCEGSIRSGPSMVAAVTPGGRLHLAQMDGKVACLGDSGGAVFSGEGAGRRLLGVISSGDGRSYTRAVSLGGEATRDFLRGAAARLGVTVSGL